MKRNRSGAKIFADATEEREYNAKKAKFLTEQSADLRYPMINGQYDISNFDLTIPARSKQIPPQSIIDNSISKNDFVKLENQVSKLTKAVEVLVKNGR